MKPGRISRLSNILIILTMLLTWSSVQVNAAPQAFFSVTANVDVVDALPGDGICETAAGNGMCTLRAAIMEANALVGEDTIFLPSGTYTLTIAGVDEDQGAKGDLDITDRLILRGTGVTGPDIDAQGIDRGFDIASSATQVTLVHLTVRNGSTTGNGGGIRNYAVLTLEDVHLYFNQADFDGGAIYSETPINTLGGNIYNNTAGASGGGIYSYSDIEMEGANITYNDAGESGGGIYCYVGRSLQISRSYIANNDALINGGSIIVLGSLVLEDSVVENSVSGEKGGGIYIATSANAALTGNDFNNNHAQDGGAIYVQGPGVLNGESLTFDLNTADGSGGAINSNGGEVTLNLTNLSSNSAADGGGIGTFAGNFMIQASTIISNTATNNGGGIATIAEMELKGVTLAENRAGDGGGIHNLGSVRIENSTLSHNSARNNGGGIYNGFYTLLYNATITANTAGTGLPSSGVGGGIYNLENQFTYLYNTILYDNHHRRLTIFTDDDCVGWLSSYDYNLVGTLTGCILVGPVDNNLVGVDPQLGELADNGGPTQTHALPVGSPAVDAGNPAGCVGNWGILLTNDQRGVGRALDGDLDGNSRCDIGAYELSRYLYLYLPAALRP